MSKQGDGGTDGQTDNREIFRSAGPVSSAVCVRACMQASKAKQFPALERAGAHRSGDSGADRRHLA